MQGYLLRLNTRWPRPSIIRDFLFAVRTLNRRLSNLGTSDTVALLGSYFKQHFKERLLSAEPGGRSMEMLLHEMSSFGAMLMHLELVRTGRDAFQFRNVRRSRTVYGTYPTPPMAAATMANYVVSHLARSSDRTTMRLIVDPTMEGAPTLLELAFVLSRRSMLRRQPIRWRIVGVDKNPIASTVVRALFSAARRVIDMEHVSTKFSLGDAFDALEQIPAIHGVTNNPPWGAKTDDADGRRLASIGPYLRYRDPYIALVSVAIRKLCAGGAFAFILPFQILAATSASKLRVELLENCVLDHVVQLPRSNFPRATDRTVMLLGRRRVNGERQGKVRVVTYPITRRVDDPCIPTSMSVSATAARRLDSAPWLTLVNAESPLLEAAQTVRLGSVARVAIGLEPYRVGRGSPKQTPCDLRDCPFTFDQATPGATPVVRGRDIRRFVCTQASEFVKVGPWLALPGRHVELADHERVFVRQICSRDGLLVAAVAAKGTIARKGLLTLLVNGIDANVLCAFLNSSHVACYIRSRCAGFHRESFNKVSPDDLRNMPVPLALCQSSRSDAGIRESIKQRAIELSEAERSGLAVDRWIIGAQIDELVGRTLIVSGNAYSVT